MTRSQELDEPGTLIGGVIKRPLAARRPAIFTRPLAVEADLETLLTAEQGPARCGVSAALREDLRRR